LFWLLHEPRLVANVPIFCIFAIKPLIVNQDAPATVNVGAIHLLMHLQIRLCSLLDGSTGTAHDSDDDEDYELVTRENPQLIWKVSFYTCIVVFVCRLRYLLHVQIFFRHVGFQS
jgi:hypothetical protein